MNLNCLAAGFPLKYTMKAKAASFSNKINNSDAPLPSLLSWEICQRRLTPYEPLARFLHRFNVTFLCVTLQKLCQTVRKLTTVYIAFPPPQHGLENYNPQHKTAAHTCKSFCLFSRSSLSFWLSLSWSSSFLLVSCDSLSDTVLFVCHFLSGCSLLGTQLTVSCWCLRRADVQTESCKCFFSTRTAPFHTHFEASMLEEMMNCCLRWALKRLFSAFFCVWEWAECNRFWSLSSGLWNTSVYSWDVFTIL